MATRFFTQDAMESFSPRELVEEVNKFALIGLPFKALEWNTKADYYGVAFTTDLDMTPEQAYELHGAWERSDYDPDVLA